MLEYTGDVAQYKFLMIYKLNYPDHEHFKLLAVTDQ